MHGTEAITKKQPVHVADLQKTVSIP